MGSVGLGKPLKSIVHPLRADVPIWLGAEGPKNVAQTAEIADGWIPIAELPQERLRTHGDAGQVKERVSQWEETGVTTLLLSCRSPEEVHLVAETLA